MKVIVFGASGLIGQDVVTRLRHLGHELTEVVHRPRNGAVSIDLGKAERSRLAILLHGHDAVVNCTGVFQDGATDSTESVHHTGIQNLIYACEYTGIKRFIHFSAMGMDRTQPTMFSRTKLAGDQALQRSKLDWVILRPSVVFGPGAYGGSALVRGLAALPFAPNLPTAKIQPVHIDDVTKTVAILLEPTAQSKLVIELAGPDEVSLHQVVSMLRTWLGHNPAKQITLPPWVMEVTYRLGDLAGWLGWRPPIRSTAKHEMQRGAVGDTKIWREVIGIQPTPPLAALTSRPASVQERWFANLYLLKPVAFGVFALFWISTGIISLGPGWDHAMAIMREGGATPRLGALSIIAGAGADILIGMSIAYRRTTRLALWCALAVSFAYAVIGTILVPRLWIDPLGPMLKIWPIVAFNLVLLAILEDR